LTKMKSPPQYIQQISTHWDATIKREPCDVSDIQVILPDQAEIVLDRNVIETTRYYHVVTESDTTADIVITLPEVVTDPKLILLYTKYGEMAYGDYWLLDPTGTTLTIYKKYILLKEGDVIEIYIYEVIPETSP